MTSISVGTLEKYDWEIGASVANTKTGKQLNTYVKVWINCY
jgi:hypothetical protein